MILERWRGGTSLWPARVGNCVFIIAVFASVVRIVTKSFEPGSQNQTTPESYPITGEPISMSERMDSAWNGKRLCFSNSFKTFPSAEYLITIGTVEGSTVVPPPSVSVQIFDWSSIARR